MSCQVNGIRLYGSTLIHLFGVGFVSRSQVMSNIATPNTIGVYREKWAITFDYRYS